MAQYFTEQVSAEPVSTTAEVHFSTHAEYETGAEVPKDISPAEDIRYPQPVPVQSRSGNTEQATTIPSQASHENGVTTAGETEEGGTNTSRIVALDPNLTTYPTRSSPDPTEDQRPKSGNHCVNCFTVSTILCGFCTTIFVSLFMTTMLLKEQHQKWEASRTLELLEGDTLLTYQDMLPVQFAATVEKGDSTQFNVSLISVDCQELEIHESLLNNSNLSVTFYTDYPIKLPSGYQHYELGSLFIYNISLIDASNISELTMRIFSNTEDAEQYISHHTNQLAQSKSVFNHTFKGNEPSSVVFHPYQASYYIPTFVAAAETTISISYFVSKKYYLFSDYIETYENQCELNPTETPCYFENSNNTEICVIAHSARTSSTNPARILLTASNTKQWEDHYFSQRIFILSLCFLIGCAVAFAVMFFCCIYKYCKNRPSKPDYMPLESRT